MTEQNQQLEPGLPCGHEADAVRVRTTTAVVAYCMRCERGFELVHIPFLVDAFGAQAELAVAWPQYAAPRRFGGKRCDSQAGFPSNVPNRAASADRLVGTGL
jgi:hypothetical protein